MGWRNMSGREVRTGYESTIDIIMGMEQGTDRVRSSLI